MPVAQLENSFETGRTGVEGGRQCVLDQDKIEVKPRLSVSLFGAFGVKRRSVAVKEAMAAMAQEGKTGEEKKVAVCVRRVQVATLSGTLVYT